MTRLIPPLLRDRDFAAYWVANLTRVLAMQMVAVAVGWQVYSVRHHPFDIGLVGLAEFLPLPLLALPTVSSPTGSRGASSSFCRS